MKDLFLIRHAKSSWTDDSLRDMDRPLNKRGKRQVEAMANPLLELGALDGPIHASHACRARQTIEGIVARLPEQNLASRVHFDPELYTFRWKRLFKWLKHVDNDAPALTLIGHNPALTDLAAILTGHQVPEMITGAVMHLKIPAATWREIAKGKGRLVQYLPPSQASYRLFQRKAPKAPEAGGDLKQQVPEALNHQLATIRALQPGVAQGVDPKFLHRFRINLRRSRAVTEAIVTITGDQTLQKSAKPLKRMAQQTSLLRDLDVFLAYLETQASENPRLRRSLKASGTMTTLRHWRESERQALCRQLDRKAWHKDLKNWEATITGKTLTKALKKATPEAIQDTVRQRGDLCLEMFRDLSPGAPDQDFHALRKALKRLRYLAELDKRRYRALLDELKDQQSLYGRFQDRHQQLTLLSELAATRVDQRLPPVLAELAQQISDEKRKAQDAILAKPPRIERP
ncbi:CHAD domain-containing protein [Marinobacter lacisalsi]|uniref:CHAD domain-containing protein n=1 Tax=Marinobacter lacisalsi TaxID=475979 RepID=A0ABV8QK53_9GAMM